MSELYGHVGRENDVTRNDDIKRTLMSTPSRYLTYVTFVITVFITISSSILMCWFTVENTNNISGMRTRIDQLESEIVSLKSIAGENWQVSPAELSLALSSVSEDEEDNTRLLSRGKRSADGEGKDRRKNRERRQNKKSKKRNRRRNKDREEKHIEDQVEEDMCQKCKANKEASIESVHFVADIKQNYSLLNEHGSHRLPNADGVLTREGFVPNHNQFKFWSPAEGNQSLPSFLHISPSGDHFTIMETGIYFIYAQVLYHDLSGRWAYGIHVDDDVVAQCTTSQTLPEEYIKSLDGHSPSHGVYTHCYTGIAVRIESRQRVSIRSLYDRRVVVALGRSTFWGMIKLKGLESSVLGHQEDYINVQLSIDV